MTILKKNSKKIHFLFTEQVPEFSYVPSLQMQSLDIKFLVEVHKVQCVAEVEQEAHLASHP